MNPRNNGTAVHRGAALLEAPWQTPGYLMIIGGADRLDPDFTIPRLFVQFVRRVEANTRLRDIVLVSTATRHPEVLTAEYIRIFAQVGYPSDRVRAPLIRNRDEAHDPDMALMLAHAAGIFVTGGDQYTLVHALDRTPVEEAIMEAYGNGAVVAGTSAGATAMGRPMLVAGGGHGELRTGVVQTAHGLGWAGEDLIIDTHFGARGRFPRLMAAIAEYPHALGVGIDENTCLILDGQWHGTVEGTGVVYFIDASHLQFNSADPAYPGHPISIGPVSVSTLSAGGMYNLRSRHTILAIGEAHRV